MNQKKKNILLTSIKAAISAALIYFIITLIDLEEFIGGIRNYPVWGLIAVVLAFCATVLIGGWRWRIFLRPFGKVPYWKLVGLHFIGYFFSNFLPSNVGGDVIRGYISGKELGDMPAAYSAVIADRIAGFVTTLMLALIALPFLPYRHSVFWATILLNSGFVFVILLFLLLPSKSGQFVKLLLSKLPGKFGEMLINFTRMLRSYRQHPKILLEGFIVSVLYQSSIILVIAWAGYYTNARMLVPFYFVSVPLVFVISLLPVSLNAIGIREASFAYFFELYGSTKGIGLLVSLITLAMAVGAGIIGGIVFAFWNSARKREAELES